MNSIFDTLFQEHIRRTSEGKYVTQLRGCIYVTTLSTIIANCVLNVAASVAVVLGAATAALAGYRAVRTPFDGVVVAVGAAAVVGTVLLVLAGRVMNLPVRTLATNVLPLPRDLQLALGRIRYSELHPHALARLAAGRRSDRWHVVTLACACVGAVSAGLSWPLVVTVTAAGVGLASFHQHVVSTLEQLQPLPGLEELAEQEFHKNGGGRS